MKSVSTANRKMLRFRNKAGDICLLSGHLTMKQLAKRGIRLRLCSPKARLKKGEWRHVP